MATLQLDSTAFLCLLFVVSCFAVVVRGLRSGRKDGVPALPPSPPGLPIIGNLHQLGSGHLHRRLQALARRHGPLFLLRLGSVPTIVISSASLAEAVLKTQDHVFCSRPQQHTARGTLYGCRDIAFSPYGERWRQIRRIAVVHLLSVKRVDSFRALRMEEVARFVQQIRAGAGEDRGGVVVYDFLPDFMTLHMQKRYSLQSEKSVLGCKKSVGGCTYTLYVDMFIAGSDTIYKTVEWTMAELVKNPRDMAKVQSEVRQVTAGKHRGVLEEELEKMTLLRAAIKEALRLHPPVPLLIPRETIQDTRLHGYNIPAKTRVMVNAWAIGRDSESWENAEEFRSERFLGMPAMDYSSKDTRFIPFGAGRRGCPGVAFGTRLVELTLANMMCHFNWELPVGQDPESFEVLESSGLSPGLKSPLILAVKPL